MKRAIEEDSQRRFSIRCEAGNRAFLSLAMVAISGAMLLGVWWPGEALELLFPWVGEDWGHSKAWIYVLFLALIGASVTLLGIYFGEWKRGYNIRFDADEGMVSTEEWWEGKEVENSFPLECFSRVEIHEEEGEWILGALLSNGSYWQLLDGKNREELEDIGGRLESLIERGKGDGEKMPELPECVNMEREEVDFSVDWPNRGHWASKLGFAVASMLLAVASVVPVVATFEGEVAWLVATLGMGTAALVLPGVMEAKLRGVSVALGAWLGVVVAGVCGLGANWAYFPLATVGLWAMGSTAVRGFIDLKSPRALWIEIDQWGAIYKEESAVTDAEGVVRAQQLEGAVTNVHRLEPATMWLVPPGGKEANIARCLNQEDASSEMPAIRLRLAGLSLFERIALSFAIDDEIRRRNESGMKIKIRPQL